MVYAKCWILLVLPIKYMVFTKTYNTFVCVHMYVLKVVCKNDVYMYFQ